MIYPDDYINKVLHGDCLELMKQIPDGSVDLVLTDPPYGHGKQVISNNKSRGKLAIAKDYGNGEWNCKTPTFQHFKEMRRISKNQIIFGGNYFIEHLHNSSCWLVWDKNNGNNDFADCELAWTSFNSAVRKIKYTWNGMLQGNMKEKEQRVHPTQKPVPLIAWILRNYSEQNQIILDPFMGSGTTCVAAKALDRRFIGIEKEQKYVDIANRRLPNTVTELFY